MLAGAAALLASAACGRPVAAHQHVRVFAAASLTAAFTELAQAYERAHRGEQVVLQCAGTPTLVMQLQQGAEADVFAAADAVHMERVVAAGRTIAAPVPFATNRLAILVARGNPRRVQGLADLARADLRVALAGPEVPAGRYARQALARAGVAVRSLSDETSVSALVGKLRLGEFDACIAYATDAAPAAEAVEAVAIPADQNALASYPIAALTPAGRAFVAFVLADEGRAALLRHGFRTP